MSTKLNPTTTDEWYREMAIKQYHKQGLIEIDQVAKVSRGIHLVGYAWVSAWVKVLDPEVPSSDDAEAARQSLDAVLRSAKHLGSDGFPLAPVVMVEADHDPDGLITGYHLEVVVGNRKDFQKQWRAWVWGDYRIVVTQFAG